MSQTLEPCDFEVSLRFRLDSIRQLFSSDQKSAFGIDGNWFIAFMAYGPPHNKQKLEIYIGHQSRRKTSNVSFKIAITYVSGKPFTTREGALPNITGQYAWSDPRLLSRSQWENDQTLQQDDALLVSACFYTDRSCPARFNALPGFLYRILTRDESADLSFYAFAKKSSRGELSCPKRYRVSSDVLRAGNNKYIHDWMESKQPTALWGPWATSSATGMIQATFLDPDSDFEDAEEESENVHCDPPWSDMDGLSAAPSDLESVSSGGTWDAGMTAAEGDSEIVPAAKNPLLATPDRAQSPSQRQLPSSPDACNGHDVFVTGMASKTLESVLYYIYTGAVVFAPLKSEGATREACLRSHAESRADRPAPCSCKSVYRVAKEMNIAHLQSTALAYLESRLSASNILAEYFSVFTSRHPEVKMMELGILAKHWEDIKSSDAFQKLVTSAMTGGQPHVAPMIAELFQKLTLSV